MSLPNITAMPTHIPQWDFETELRKWMQGHDSFNYSGYLLTAEKIALELHMDPAEVIDHARVVYYLMQLRQALEDSNQEP